MAISTPYTRGTSFTDAQSADPLAPLSGPAVDGEFDRIKLTIDSLVDALDRIQRDDGRLANASVGADQIEPAVYTGLQPAAVWTTGVDYSVNETVFVTVGSDVELHRCLVAHEATVFADDLAAGYWQLLADFTPPAVAGVIGIASGGTGATTAVQAQANLGLGYLAALQTAPIPIQYGGTGGTSAAAARVALGVGIGTQVQAYSSVLDAMAAVTPAADKIPYFTSASAASVATLTGFARTLLDDANAAAARVTLGLGAGLVAVSPTVTDWDDATESGVYVGADTAANSPTSNFHHGFVSSVDSNNLVQMLVERSADSVWVRRRSAGTWSSWVKLALASGLPVSAVDTDRTISAASTFTWTHGLGAAPEVVTARLVCQTGEHGYTAGQVIRVPIGVDASNRGISIIEDATDIVVKMGSGAQIMAYPNATTGAGAALTYANWKLRLQASV